MENEVNPLLQNNNVSNNIHIPSVSQNPVNNENEEKKPLQDLDISHMIFIKNPNNEMAIGNFSIVL
jgi:hypothetical protein